MSQNDFRVGDKVLHSSSARVLTVTNVRLGHLSVLEQSPPVPISECTLVKRENKFKAGDKAVDPIDFTVYTVKDVGCEYTMRLEGKPLTFLYVSETFLTPEEAAKELDAARTRIQEHLPPKSGTKKYLFPVGSTAVDKKTGEIYTIQDVASVVEGYAFQVDDTRYLLAEELMTIGEAIYYFKNKIRDLKIASKQDPNKKLYTAAISNGLKSELAYTKAKLARAKISSCAFEVEVKELEEEIRLIKSKILW